MPPRTGVRATDYRSLVDAINNATANIGGQQTSIELGTRYIPYDRERDRRSNGRDNPPDSHPHLSIYGGGVDNQNNQLRTLNRGGSSNALTMVSLAVALPGVRMDLNRSDEMRFVPPISPEERQPGTNIPAIADVACVDITFTFPSGTNAREANQHRQAYLQWLRANGAPSAMSVPSAERTWQEETRGPEGGSTPEGGPTRAIRMPISEAMTIVNGRAAQGNQPAIPSLNERLTEMGRTNLELIRQLQANSHQHLQRNNDRPANQSPPQPFQQMPEAPTSQSTSQAGKDNLLPGASSNGSVAMSALGRDGYLIAAEANTNTQASGGYEFATATDRAVSQSLVPYNRGNGRHLGNC